LDGGPVVDEEEMFEAFGDHDQAAFAEEVERRWGDTDAYRESTRRTKRYTNDDWREIRAETEAIGRELAAQLEAGVAPQDGGAMALAERHRLRIDRRFYPCSHAMHRALGDLYVDDARFREHFERVRTGLAAYVRDTIRANAARSGRGGEERERRSGHE